MSDDIFEETEENLRADQWTTIAKKSWPYAAGLIGIVLFGYLGTIGFQAFQSSQASKASEVYEAGVDGNTKDDKAIAAAKFDAAAKSGTPAYKAMALMQLGAEALKADKTDEAIKDFDAAAKADSSPLISDLAAYKAALIAMDKAPYSEMEKRLKPLTADKRPYAPLAKEALAMAKLQAGDVAGARADFSVLSLTLGTPDGIKNRAEGFKMAIDSGVAPSAQALLKLPEAQAPVMPAIDPAQLQALQAQAAAQQQQQPAQ